MSLDKLPVPVSICTVCHAVNRNHSLINFTCGLMVDGKRCKGVWTSALHEDDWEECPTCHATSNSCETCNGEGWMYTRK